MGCGSRAPTATRLISRDLAKRDRADLLGGLCARRECNYNPPRGNRCVTRLPRPNLDRPPESLNVPIYEYTCKQCDAKFDQLQRTMSAAEGSTAAVKCPSCGSTRTAR